MNIVNLTQHEATPDQIAAGVLEVADKATVQKLLTFEEPPTPVEMAERARILAGIAAATASTAMIGGAPFFMGRLEAALKEAGVKPVYAFTRREAVDAPDGNGGVRKTQVFRHAGWVEA